MGIRPSVPPILKTYFDFFLAYVLEEITRSTELLGTRARIGRGVGAGTDDDRQPAVIWVKSLENVIYGSKVEQKVIKIPAEQIHLTLGEIGTDAHSVLKGSDRIPTTRARKLSVKNHAVVCIGFVVSGKSHAEYKDDVIPKREFLSGILTRNDAGKFILGEV